MQPTNFRVNYEDFNFVEMVYGTGSQILCKRMAKLATQLLNSPVFNLALCHINLVDRDVFKDRSNAGKVLIGCNMSDLGNTCYTTLWQLCLLCMRKGASESTAANIGAVILRYPSLADKWPQSENSIVLKGDVIEYVLWLVHNIGSMAPDYVTNAMQLNTLLCEWDNYWKKLLRILAGHLGYELTDSKLPTCRDLAQLIGLAASASRLDEADLDRALKYYTRGGEDA